MANLFSTNKHFEVCCCYKTINLITEYFTITACFIMFNSLLTWGNKEKKKKPVLPSKMSHFCTLNRQKSTLSLTLSFQLNIQIHSFSVTHHSIREEKYGVQGTQKQRGLLSICKKSILFPCLLAFAQEKAQKRGHHTIYLCCAWLLHILYIYNIYLCTACHDHNYQPKKGEKGGKKQKKKNSPIFLPVL